MSDEPKMLYYDADGKRVAAGSSDINSQYLSDDPARPDSRSKPAAGLSINAPEPPEDAEADADDGAGEQKAVAAPKADKARGASANK